MKHRYIRWMIRTALVYLLAGIALGVLTFLSHKVAALRPLVAWRTVHVHLILVGAVIQMIMGVALWMFPRRAAEPRWPTERQGMTLYVIFNLGTVVRSACGPYWSTSDAVYACALAGILAQTGGIIYFLILIAGRVRGVMPDVPPS